MTLTAVRRRQAFYSTLERLQAMDGRDMEIHALYGLSPAELTILAEREDHLTSAHTELGRAAGAGVDPRGATV